MRHTFHQPALLHLVHDECDGGGVHQEVTTQVAERPGPVSRQKKCRQQQITGPGELEFRKHLVPTRGNRLVGPKKG